MQSRYREERGGAGEKSRRVRMARQAAFHDDRSGPSGFGLNARPSELRPLSLSLSLSRLAVNPVFHRVNWITAV